MKKRLKRLLNEGVSVTVSPKLDDDEIEELEEEGYRVNTDHPQGHKVYPK